MGKSCCRAMDEEEGSGGTRHTLHHCVAHLSEHPLTRLGHVDHVSLCWAVGGSCLVGTNT